MVEKFGTTSDLTELENLVLIVPIDSVHHLKVGLFCLLSEPLCVSISESKGTAPSPLNEPSEEVVVVEQNDDDEDACSGEWFSQLQPGNKKRCVSRM